MTQFPVSATLEIKGLIRPAMLMSYIKVNAFFYGHRHISSGIYFVTKQVDRIDGKGYRTILSLTRFAGDEDAITTETEQVTYKVPKVTKRADGGLEGEFGGRSTSNYGRENNFGSSGNNPRITTYRDDSGNIVTGNASADSVMYNLNVN